MTLHPLHKVSSTARRQKVMFTITLCPQKHNDFSTSKAHLQTKNSLILKATLEQKRPKGVTITPRKKGKVFNLKLSSTELEISYVIQPYLKIQTSSRL